MTEQLPTINWRTPPTVEDYEFWASILNDELIERLRLVYGQGALTTPEYGIVALTDPAAATLTTDALAVSINGADAFKVDVHPGVGITPNGHRVLITQVQTLALPFRSAGDANVVYARYQTEETLPRRKRNAVGTAPSRVTEVTEPNRVVAVSRAAYEALTQAVKDETVVLALVSIQNTTAGLVAVVDMSQSVLSYSRPWFSPVDIKHRTLLGTGTPTTKNPHGLSISDTGATADLTVWDALIGRGVMISPSQSSPRIAGVLCTAMIPVAQWVNDAAGAVTGVGGANYIVLEDYPVNVGLCVALDGNQDDATLSEALPIKLVYQQNIAYLDPGVPVPVVTCEFRYTAVKGLQPPSSFNDGGPHTYGTMTAREAVITNGLSVGPSDVDDYTLSFEGLGPVARRMRVVFLSDGTLRLIPQTLIAQARLSVLEVTPALPTTVLLGGSRIRVWLWDAIAGPTLSVAIKVTGVDVNGGAINETLTFNAAWANNPTPATVELPAQSLSTTLTFGDLTKVEVLSRVDDGPLSQITVDAIPDAGYSPLSQIDGAFQVASLFWDGFRVQDQRDIRTLRNNLRLDATNSAYAIGKAVLGSVLASNPAGSKPLSLIFGEDFDQQRGNDLRFSQATTNRDWGLDTGLDLDDPRDAASNPEGVNYFWYSRIIPTKAGTKWLGAILSERARQLKSGGVFNDVKVRIHTSAGTWLGGPSWYELEEDTGLVDGLNEHGYVYLYKNFETLLGIKTIDYFQIRVMAKADGLTVFSSTVDPKIVSGSIVDALFQIEHHYSGADAGIPAAIKAILPGATGEGRHKQVHVIPNGVVGTGGMLNLFFDPAELGTGRALQVFDAAQAIIFWINASGSATLTGQLTAAGLNGGTLSVSGNGVVTGKLTTKRGYTKTLKVGGLASLTGNSGEVIGTSLVETAVASETFLANTLPNKTRIRYRAVFQVTASAGGAAALLFKIRAGLTGPVFAVHDLHPEVINDYLAIDGELFIEAAGVAAWWKCMNTVQYGQATGMASYGYWSDYVIDPTALNTTAALSLIATIQWQGGGAGAGDKVRLRYFRVSVDDDN